MQKTYSPLSWTFFTWACQLNQKNNSNNSLVRPHYKEGKYKKKKAANLKFKKSNLKFPGWCFHLTNSTLYKFLLNYERVFSHLKKALFQPESLSISPSFDKTKKLWSVLSVSPLVLNPFFPLQIKRNIAAYGFLLFGKRSTFHRVWPCERKFEFQ